jgi:hypothetical protein
LADSVPLFAADTGGTDHAAFAGHESFFDSCAGPSIPAIVQPWPGSLRCSNVPADAPAESAAYILSSNRAGFVVDACSVFWAD